MRDGQDGLADAISKHEMLTNQILQFNFKTVAKHWLQYVRLVLMLAPFPPCQCPSSHCLYCKGLETYTDLLLRLQIKQAVNYEYKSHLLDLLTFLEGKKWYMV